METTYPLSRYIRIILFITIGYSPLVPLFLTVGDIDWNRSYGSETLAWLIVFSIFDLLAIIEAIRLFKAALVFSVITIVFAMVPLAWGWLAWVETGLGPSSMDDTNPYGAMIDFWLNGGGFIAGIIVIPIGIWYVYLRFRERKKTVIAQMRQPMARKSVHL